MRVPRPAACVAAQVGLSLAWPAVDSAGAALKAAYLAASNPTPAAAGGGTAAAAAAAGGRSPDAAAGAGSIAPAARPFVPALHTAHVKLSAAAAAAASGGGAPRLTAQAAAELLRPLLCHTGPAGPASFDNGERSNTSNTSNTSSATTTSAATDPAMAAAAAAAPPPPLPAWCVVTHDLKRFAITCAGLGCRLPLPPPPGAYFDTLAAAYVFSAERFRPQEK